MLSEVLSTKIAGVGKDFGARYAIDSGGPLCVNDEPGFWGRKFLEKANHFSIVVTPQNSFAVGKVQEEESVWKPIHANHETIIKISVDRSTETTSELKRIRADKRGCLYEDEKVLDFFDTYSEANCVLECAWKRAASECQCVPLFLADLFSKRDICEAHGNRCFKRLVKARYQAKVKECFSECRHDCEFAEYSIDIDSKDIR